MCWFELRRMLLLVVGLINVFAGTILFTAGICYLIQLPVMQVGSSVWTGAWTTLTGALLVYLTHSNEIEVLTHKTLILLVLVVSCIVNVINIIILEVADFGISMRRKDMAMLQKMNMEQTMMIAYHVVLACSAMGFANGFLASQIVFCCMTFEGDAGDEPEIQKNKATYKNLRNNTTNFDWVFTDSDPKSPNKKSWDPISFDNSSPQGDVQLLTMKAPNEKSDRAEYPHSSEGYIEKYPSASEVRTNGAKLAQHTAVVPEAAGRSSSDPALGRNAEYNFVRNLNLDTPAQGLRGLARESDHREDCTKVSVLPQRNVNAYCQPEMGAVTSTQVILETSERPIVKKNNFLSKSDAEIAMEGQDLHPKGQLEDTLLPSEPFHTQARVISSQQKGNNNRPAPLLLGLGRINPPELTSQSENSLLKGGHGIQSASSEFQSPSLSKSEAKITQESRNNKERPATHHPANNDSKIPIEINSHGIQEDLTMRSSFIRKKTEEETTNPFSLHLRKFVNKNPPIAQKPRHLLSENKTNTSVASVVAGGHKSHDHMKDTFLDDLVTTLQRKRLALAPSSDSLNVSSLTDSLTEFK